MYVYTFVCVYMYMDTYTYMYKHMYICTGVRACCFMRMLRVLDSGFGDLY